MLAGILEVRPISCSGNFTTTWGPKVTTEIEEEVGLELNLKGAKEGGRLFTLLSGLSKNGFDSYRQNNNNRLHDFEIRYDVQYEGIKQMLDKLLI